MTGDDRRKLLRDAAGCQSPAPVARPTPPAELPSAPVVAVKTAGWFVDLVRSPRDAVARAIYGAIPGEEVVAYDDLDEGVQLEYLELADAALDAVAPLLRGPLFRSVQARRDSEFRQALLLAQQLSKDVDEAVTDLLRTEAKLQRYRESVRAMARIIQKKRAGANRQVAYYKRQFEITRDLLRRRVR